jgi:hypothetical protein
MTDMLQLCLASNLIAIWGYGYIRIYEFIRIYEDRTMMVA